MSVQIAKSGGGGTPTAGRRTPLSLSGSATKTKTQANDPDKDASNSEGSSTVATPSNAKGVTKGDQVTIETKKTNDKSDKKNANTENQATENTNSAKEKGSDDKKKDDKKKDKDSSKKDEKNQENGVNEGKESSKTNGHKDDDKKAGDKNEKSTGFKGTARQKEQKMRRRESEQKEKEKEPEVIEIKDDDKQLESKKSDEKKIVVRSEAAESKQTKKKIEDTAEKHGKDDTEKELELKKKPKKEPETPKKDEKKAREIGSSTPTKDIPSKQTVPNQSIASLAIEKDLKGFTTDGEEMESLIFESESDANIAPIETSTPGKILKIKQGLSSAIYSVPYESQDIYEKPESEFKTADRPTIAAAPLERPQFTSSYRAISGRRSLRPLKEYSFQGTYRDSYRKINTELDYTASSMNVTVGSEIPNESSFSLFGRGKKRDRTPPVSSSSESNNEAQTDIELSPKSPKRAKLDFSGIIGIVSSPMTLLRTKLTRTKIQCSTPNGKVTSTTKEDEEGVENVSVIANEEEMVSNGNDIGDASEDVNLREAEPAGKEINDEFREDADMEISENLDAIKKPSQITTASLENVNKRRMCNVM